jgi:hypothetical protein
MKCLNSLNGECNDLSVNLCRDIINSSFKCTNLIDGWCVDMATNSCVIIIPNNICRDQNTNVCKNITYDKSFCKSDDLKNLCIPITNSICR